MKEESKVTELGQERLERLEKQVKELKADKDKEIKEIIFCEVIFDPSKYMIGQKKCNLLLKKGFQVFNPETLCCSPSWTRTKDPLINSQML